VLPLKTLAGIGLLTASLVAQAAAPHFDEVVVGKVVADGQQLTINVGSNGCTGKQNFRMDIQKEKGVGISSNYVLTLVQIARDECKAIFDEGIDLVYDLKKELGIEPHNSYTLTNKVYVD
jgi:hypothetical protein